MTTQDKHITLSIPDLWSHEDPEVDGPTNIVDALLAIARAIEMCATEMNVNNERMKRISAQYGESIRIGIQDFIDSKDPEDLDS